MSETIFVFPAAPRSDIIRILDELAVAQTDQWVAEGPIFVWLADEARGLYADWEPEAIANLERAAGHRPQWGVEIRYRLSLRQSMVSIAVGLLSVGGIAVDDFCTHAWTAAEVGADMSFAGGRFGEPPVRT